MLIGNNLNTNIQTQIFNRKINNDKAEISNETKEIGLTEVVTKNEQINKTEKDIFKSKSFNMEENNINNSFNELKNILKQDNVNENKLTEFIQKKENELKENSNKVTTSLNINTFNDIIDSAKKIKESISNNQVDKYKDLTSDIYKKQEIYLSSIMSTHNLMDSIIKQKG